MKQNLKRQIKSETDTEKKIRLEQRLNPYKNISIATKPIVQRAARILKCGKLNSSKNKNQD